MIAEKQDWAHQPTALLREEHDIITRALGILERQARSLDGGNPAARERIAALAEFIREFADRRHHGKEEDVLFAAMVDAGMPRHVGPIGMMLAEHDQGRGYVKAMESPDDRVAAKAARDYATLLSSHIQKENGILFPMAEEVLPPEVRERVAHRFAELEDAAGGAASRASWVARLEALAKE